MREVPGSKILDSKFKKSTQSIFFPEEFLRLILRTPHQTLFIQEFLPWSYQSKVNTMAELLHSFSNICCDIPLNILSFAWTHDIRFGWGPQLLCILPQFLFITTHLLWKHFVNPYHHTWYTTLHIPYVACKDSLGLEKVSKGLGNSSKDPNQALQSFEGSYLAFENAHQDQDGLEKDLKSPNKWSGSPKFLICDQRSFENFMEDWQVGWTRQKKCFQNSKQCHPGSTKPSEFQQGFRTDLKTPKKFPKALKALFMPQTSRQIIKRVHKNNLWLKQRPPKCWMWHLRMVKSLKKKEAKQKLSMAVLEKRLFQFRIDVRDLSGCWHITWDWVFWAGSWWAISHPPWRVSLAGGTPRGNWGGKVAQDFIIHNVMVYGGTWCEWQFQNADTKKLLKGPNDQTSFMREHHVWLEYFLIQHITSSLLQTLLVFFFQYVFCI